MLKRITLSLVSPLWVLISLFLSFMIYSVFVKYYIGNTTYFQFLFIGFVAYLLSMFIIKPVKYKFWDTFFHEVSHIIFAVLTFAKPNTLVIGGDAADKGAAGYAGYSFKKSTIMSFIRNHLVSLAPYFFSPITVFLILIFLMVLPEKQSFIAEMFSTSPSLNGLMFLIGFTYSYHLRTSFKQARPYQSDFDSVGFIYGMSFVLCMQLLFLTLFISILSSSMGSFNYIFELSQEVLITLQNFLSEYVS